MGRIIAPLNFPLVPLDNLIAFWNLDETSGTRYDSSGNGRNLTQTFGTVSSTTGKIKNCAYFNGINGGGSTNSKLGSTSFGVNPNSNFSMSVWIKPRSFNSLQHIIGAPFQNGFYIGADDTDLTFNLYNGTVFGVTAPTVSSNTWHHYVFIREGDTLKLYADNTYIGSTDITEESFDGNPVFSVGGGEFNEYYFNGDIDALGLWTRVLTESEIGNLYNNGNGKQYIDNKISIKKQNLGGGKINLRPRVYAFIATNTGIGTSPNINNLKFYDTGLTQNGQIIYYDETKVYWLTYFSGFWIIAPIGTTGASGLFVKFSGIDTVGSYSGVSGYIGTATISAI